MVFGSGERPLYEIKANLFKGLAHPYRIRVLELLAAADEVAVSDLLRDTGLEASHLSQHLAVLRRYGLVVSERRANVVLYRLAHDQVAGLPEFTQHGEVAPVHRGWLGRVRRPEQLRRLAGGGCDRVAGQHDLGRGAPRRRCRKIGVRKCM